MNYITQLISGFHHLQVKDLGIIAAILVMDAALSADNSVAINALALNAKEKSRAAVIWCGLGFAAILRVIGLALATWIIANPWIQVVGGLYLMYLVYGHFFGSKEGSEDTEHTGKSSSFIAILWGIGLLDISLSTDNIIAVVSMSQNFAIVVTGVLGSILLLAIASQLVRKIMEKIPSLESGAYIILAFLAIIMWVGHGAETIVWLGEKTHFYPVIQHAPGILKWSYNTSDIFEILGVAIILTGAIIYDKLILPGHSHSLEN